MERCAETALLLQILFKKDVTGRTWWVIVCAVLSSGVISHHASDKEVEVSFGEYVAGASAAPGIFLGTSNSRDRGRIRWHRALIVRTHRESTVSRQALRIVFFPAEIGRAHV